LLQAIARQLLTDERPAAQQRLCELLRSPTAADCINLPLLQELLQLQQQQPSSQQHPGRFKQHIAGRTLEQQQWRRPWLGQLLQQFDAAQLAQQLSSAEAAALRTAAVQHLLASWQSSQQQQQQQQPPNGSSRQNNRIHVQRQQQHQAKHAVSHIEHSEGSALSSNSRRTHRPSAAVGLVFAWLFKAGWRGLLLILQLVVVAVALSVKQLLFGATAYWKQRQKPV
jgi:hypothetical protein